MARKKLNKKVGIIGIIFLAGIILVAIVAYFHFNKDPYKLMADAQTALVEATELEAATISKPSYTPEEEKLVIQAYGQVTRNYVKAIAHAKDNIDLKIDILLKVAEFHLINTEFHKPNWVKAIGCWNGIINYDPKHIEARKKLLNFYYEANYWKSVEENATELIDVMTQKDMPLDAYTMTAKGRALLEIANSGQTTNPNNTIDEAISILKKVIELTPEDVEVYGYLAQATEIKGQIENSLGITRAIDTARQGSEEILQKAIESATDKAKANILLLKLKLNWAKQDLATTARDRNARQIVRDKIKAMSKDFEALTETFNNNAETYQALAECYMASTETLNNAVEAITKAIELDKENVQYTITAANLYYRKSSINKDEDSLHKAIKIANDALEFPDTQDLPGPKQTISRQNKYSLLTLLAICYIEQAIEADIEEDKKQDYITRAKDAVHQIEQLIGASENINVIKWRGMLALAKGNVTTAIQQMYKAHAELKATNKTYPRLAYMLSQVLKGKKEIGARRDYLVDAIQGGITTLKPEIFIDYAEIALELNQPMDAVYAMLVYTQEYQPSQYSQRLLVRGYIQANQLEKAEEVIAEMEPDDAITLKSKLFLIQKRIAWIASTQTNKQTTDLLQEEEKKLPKYQKERVDILNKLLEMKPENVNIEPPIAACNHYVSNGDIESTKKLIDKFIEYAPDNITAKIYRKALDEPDPINIQPDRYQELTVEALSKITDQAIRHQQLAIFYRLKNMPDKALIELQKARAIDPDNKDVFEIMFTMAIQNENLELAGQLAEEAKTKNFDECGGNFFAARLDLANKAYDSALKRLDECLEIHPIMSRVYTLKSRVFTELEEYEKAAKEATISASMDPTDKRTAKQHVIALSKRNASLGSFLTTEHKTELEQALAKAIALNPNERLLLGMYAENISSHRPESALAIRQKLAKRYPTVKINLSLANMASRMAIVETNSGKKQGLFEIAAAAYQKAYELEPENERTLELYSEYLRLTDQFEKAEELLSNHKYLLYRLYLRSVQYNAAKEILEQLYKDNPKDEAALRGLMEVAKQTALDTNRTSAEKTAAKKNLIRYSNERLAIENSIGNQLLQVQLFLEVNLLKEAELKLESIKERSPNNPKALLLKAWAMMSKGQLDESLVLINQSLETESENAIAWRLRGQVNNLLGQFNQAIQDLQKSKSIDPSPTVQIELAQIYHKANRSTEAIGELTVALQDDRTPTHIRSILEELYMRTDRTTDLWKFYNDTLEKYPESDHWNYRAGKFALQQRNFDQAEKYFLKAWQISLKTSGGGLSAFDGYATALENNKKYDQVISFVSKYIDTPIAPVAYLRLATTQLRLGNKAKSIGYYHKALEKAGTNDNFIIKILSNMSAEVGLGEVEKWCGKKLQANPRSIAANLTMFRLNQSGGNFNKAISYIDKCLQFTDPEQVAWLEFSVMKGATLITIYQKTGNRESLLRAIKEYETMIEHRPNNAGLLNNLAYLLADNNEQLDKALEYAKRASDSSPNDPAKMDTYAYTLLKNKEYNRAEELLQRAVQLYSKENLLIPWDIYEHLGMTQEALEKKSSAKTTYETAIRLAGDNISEEDKKDLELAIERVSN